MVKLIICIFITSIIGFNNYLLVLLIYLVEYYDTIVYYCDERYLTNIIILTGIFILYLVTLNEMTPTTSATKTLNPLP